MFCEYLDFVFSVLEGQDLGRDREKEIVNQIQMPKLFFLTLIPVRKEYRP